MNQPNLTNQSRWQQAALAGALILMVARVGQLAALKPVSVDRSGAAGASDLCLSRASQLDKCLPKLVVYGDRKFDAPQNDDQLDKHCAMLDENLRCVSSYSRECLPSFARNLYSVLTRRLKVQFNKRCRTPEGRRDFLNMMACADLKQMEPLHKCMDSFIVQLEHIGQGSQSRQIELTCCTFQLFQDCIFAGAKRNHCPNRVVSPEKSIEYVRSIINSMGGDMMDLMCGRYDTLAACRTGYPKFMLEFKQMHERVLNGTLKPKSGSPVRPMLQLFIDQQERTDSL